MACSRSRFSATRWVRAAACAGVLRCGMLSVWSAPWGAVRHGSTGRHLSPLSAQGRESAGSLDIASIKGASLSVVSGLNEDLDAFAACWRSAASAPPAFGGHCGLALSRRDPAAVGGLSADPLHAPQIPMISNVTGDWLTVEEAPTQCIGFGTCAHRPLCRRPGEIANPHRLSSKSGGKTLCSLAKTQAALKADQVINSLPPGRRR